MNEPVTGAAPHGGPIWRTGPDVRRARPVQRRGKRVVISFGDVSCRDAGRPVLGGIASAMRAQGSDSDSDSDSGDSLTGAQRPAIHRNGRIERTAPLAETRRGGCDGHGREREGVTS
jgi:hypothetical protein